MKAHLPPSKKTFKNEIYTSDKSNSFPMINVYCDDGVSLKPSVYSRVNVVLTTIKQPLQEMP